MIDETDMRRAETSGLSDHPSDVVERARRDGDGEHVVDTRPREILFHLAHRRLAQPDRLHDVEGIRLHEDHLRRLRCDVGARTDRDADVCLSECGCVVDSISNHGDDAAFLLELDHLRRFVLRLHFSEDSLDSDRLAQHARQSVSCRHSSAPARRLLPSTRESLRRSKA